MGLSLDPWGSLTAGILFLLGLVAWYGYRHAPVPTIYFSDTSTVKKATPTLRILASKIPKILLASSFLSLLIGLMDPTFREPLTKEKTSQQPITAPSGRPPPVEGIAIYLVLDQSGSMAEKILTRDEQGRRTGSPKINILKSITDKFIAGDPGMGLQGRPEDMIGIVTFARTARVVSPLTLDHQELLKRLKELDVVKTDDQQGTSIGYAVFKTANLITATRHFAQELISEGKPAYTIKSAVILLMTDGLQENNPEDKGKKWRLMPVEEAANFAAQNDIRLYIVNVDPKFNDAKFAPARRELERNAAKTGGKFFLADDRHNLADIYSQIEQLEKSSLPSLETDSTGIVTEKPIGQMREKHYAWFFIGLALVLLLLATAIETLWLRRVP